MTELPSWVASAVEVFAYVVFGPPLVLYAVICAGCIIFMIAHPIWVAIRGHDTNDALHPITRLLLGLIDLGLLWSFIGPWL